MVSLFDISIGLGGVDSKALKKLKVNLIRANTENTKRYPSIG
jgi:hypothetical protein